MDKFWSAENPLPLVMPVDCISLRYVCWKVFVTLIKCMNDLECSSWEIDCNQDTLPPQIIVVINRTNCESLCYFTSHG